MSDKLYDLLNKIQRWLPALGTFYLTLCKIYPSLMFGNEVNETIVAVATLLAMTLEVSTTSYHKKQEEAKKDLYQGEE